MPEINEVSDTLEKSSFINEEADVKNK